MLDDVGVDRIGAYGEHPLAGPTPNVDALAAGGMLFRDAYTNPLCSPTRAQLLTGRHAFRTGIGAVCTAEDFDHSLPLSETTLAEALGGGLVVGKWHLVDGTGTADHPLLSGFDHHRGTLRQLGADVGGDYYRWQRHVDGELTISNTYATTQVVDDALELIAQAPEPWFCYVPFNAAHEPWQAPPVDLYTVPLPTDTPPHWQAAYHRAIIEAADTEIGRLLEGIDLDDTYVFVLGDNGTPGVATLPPFDSHHAKGTVYEGGIHVPLVAGPGVVPSESDDLVCSTDVFATACELRDVASAAEDSISFAPVLLGAGPGARVFAYAERFRPNGFAPYEIHRRAIRDRAGYKLVVDDAGVQELYHLPSDPFEASSLAPPYTAEARAARAALLRELESLR